MTNFLYLVLHLARKVTCYFWLFCVVLVSVSLTSINVLLKNKSRKYVTSGYSVWFWSQYLLRTSINVLLKNKSRNYLTWIANLTKLFLSVWKHEKPSPKVAHNQLKVVVFSIANCPQTSPKLNFCSIRIAHCATYV